jgi:hypothetical protein
MENFENQISAYLDKELSAEEIIIFEKEIEKNAVLKEEVAQMQLLRQNMNEMPIPQFNEQKVRNFFYAMLDKELSVGTQSKSEQAPFEQAKKGFLNFLLDKFGLLPFPLTRLVQAFLFLFVGAGAGYFFSPSRLYEKQMTQLSSEMQSMKEVMMLTLLEQKSPSERLKAVSLTSELEDINDKVIDALLQTLDNDTNINVRLAAVEALYNFRENPQAREGLIKSVCKQESPLMQVALVEVIIALQDKKNLPVLQELIKQKNLNESVKIKAESGIESLKL